MLAFDGAGMRASLCYHLIAVPGVDDHLLGGEAVIENVVLIQGTHYQSRIIVTYEIHIIDGVARGIVCPRVVIIM